MAFIAAVRPIDLAIFCSLGLLWLGGGVFIFVLYRWLRRFDAESGLSAPKLDSEVELSHQATATEALAVRS